MSTTAIVLVTSVFVLLLAICFTVYMIVRHKRRSAFIYPRNDPLLGNQQPDTNHSSLRCTASSNLSSSLDSQDDKIPKFPLTSNLSSGEINSDSQSFSLSFGNCTYLPSQTTLSDLRMSRQASTVEGIQESASCNTLSSKSELNKTKSTLF